MILSMKLCHNVQLTTPYATQEALEIRSVTPDKATLSKFDVVDYTVDLGATYNNPFDSTEVQLDLIVSYPDKPDVTIPGFYAKPFSRSLVDGKEIMAPAGEGSWHVRFSPREAATATLKFVARDKSGTAELKEFTVTVAPSDAPGAIRVSGQDTRFFAFENKAPYWPVGPNTGWAGDRGTYAFDDWFGKLGDQGANYARLWLNPQWATFAMETPGKPADGKGFGFINQANAARLDTTMELAKREGIYLMLCIESFNILRTNTSFPLWPEAVVNSDNGGPLRSPREFWTNAKMAKGFKDKLRYLVARYGAYDQTMAWEFWNEVDLTDEFEVDRTREWHGAMSQYLRLIDPYRRLITTSFGNTTGYKAIDLMPGLDFFLSHYYGGDPGGEVVRQQSRKGGQGRPHFFGEIGADVAGPRSEDDPTGIQVHDPMWASIATGSSGAASAWFWDNLIEPKNLWGLFGAVSRFVKDVDWAGEGFRQTKPTLGYQNPPSTPPMKHVEFVGGPVSWERSAANSPRSITIDKLGKVSGDTPLAGILHGRQNHPELFNPVTFRTNFVKPTKFELDVDGVSGHSGSGFQIDLDGVKLLSRVFADDDAAKTETMSQFAGKFEVEVPGGPHTLAVYSTGPDWFLAGFRFVDAVPRTGPPVEGWSVVGETKALAWVRRDGLSWRQAIYGKPATAPPSVMGLTGLAMGRWKVEVWDTRKGEVMQTTFASVKLDGKIRVNLPAMAKDVAVKLVKQ